MFYSINGTLELLRQGLAVLDAGGVGFKLTISDNTYSALSQKQNTKVKLFTHLSVREDDMELFGFFTEAELDMFKLLITVSGVGPKAAMSILSAFTPEKFVLAVTTDDKRAISKANGIGPKTAARIILELHDKIASDTLTSSFDTALAGGVTASPLVNDALAQAEEALLVLGYGKSEIRVALSGLDLSAMSVEDMIRAALKKLAR